MSDFVIATYPHPAVMVSLDGDLRSANSQGEALFRHLDFSHPVLQSQFFAGRSFKLFLEDGVMLKGTMLESQGDVCLLEWHTLSEVEQRLALFQAVSKSVNSSLILEEIFESLGEVLRMFIPFDAGTIVILDESQNSTKVLVTLDAEGQVAIRGDNKEFSGYDPMLHELLARPQPRLIDSETSSSLLIHPASSQTILVPLASKGLVIGAIGLSGKQYTPMHMQLLEEVSEQLAVAVENARLYWQTQNQAGREFLINQITKSIRQFLDIEQILRTTAQEVGKVMGLSRCLIHYWGSQSKMSQHFEYVLPGVTPVSYLEGFAAFQKDLFTRRKDPLQQYNPFILNDIRQFDEARFLEEEEKIKSLAVFPILLQDQRFVGVITLHQCDTYRAWLTEEIDLLQAIAEHVAVALYQADLFEEKERRRKQLEDTLKELQQTQMHLIQSEKMAVLGQFVAGIAHEVNTPLGTLVANDDTVKHCLEEIQVKDEKSQKYHQTAIDLLKINKLASERIQEIVRNLRNFARLDESDLKRVDLHEGLDSTLLLISSSLKHGIAVQKNYGQIPEVECFPGLLNQVFMNLLVNASQSIEEKGQISIQTRFDPDKNQIHVTIEDTGKGIAPENLPRIFDPGFTTKGVGVGTGLGLALCYKIIEKHHGQIDVKSVPGSGTTMTVSIPVTQP